MKALFVSRLNQWYHANKRVLPWRSDKSPYRVWLSEIILQQTQIKQGLPYFMRFTEKYPELKDLAAASETDVLKLWQGLGYYSRARNMHYTAQYIMQSLGGVFPNNYKELLKLKGVGDYTASAIASICFGEPVPCIDGNVYRFLGRYFNIDTPVPSSTALKVFKQVASAHFDHQSPGDFNQALMEFGALHCTPTNPKCTACPFEDSCDALAQKTVAERPVKKSKPKVRKRYFNYYVITDPEGYTLFEVRKGQDIWQGLYQFPMAETDEPIYDVTDLNIPQQWQIKDHIQSIDSFYPNRVTQRLTHQLIEAQFWMIQIDQPLIASLNKINIEEVKDKPTCKIISSFLSEINWVMSPRTVLT